METELKKIEVDTMPDQIAQMPKKRKFSWKFIGIPLLVFIIFVVIVGIMLLPLRGVIAKAKEALPLARQTADALKNQDLLATKDGLAKTRIKATELSKEYSKVKPLSYIPFLGRYITDGFHVVNAGLAALDAADRAIEALEPNADLLGFTGGSKFVQGSADQRIQVAVKTMSALTPKLNEMAIAVEMMRKELDQIDPNRYPVKVGKTVIREKLIVGKEVIDNAANLFVNAQPLLKSLPSMLGEPEMKRYLILFQNDKELRSTGGFLTAYAQFRFDKGKITLELSDDIYSLDSALKKSSKPQERF